MCHSYLEEKTDNLAVASQAGFLHPPYILNYVRHVYF